MRNRVAFRLIQLARWVATDAYVETARRRYAANLGHPGKSMTLVVSDGV